MGAAGRRGPAALAGARVDRSDRAGPVFHELWHERRPRAVRDPRREAVGVGACGGDEWLGHPGRVGRPWGGPLVRIVGDDGREVPPGAVGEIYLKTPGGTVYGYLGDVPPLPVTDDGFATAGDLG